MPLTRRKFISTGLFLTTGLILTDALWLEKFFIETNEFYIGEATRDTANIKVVQISDLHLRSVKHQHKQLANKLNRLKPELIVITGKATE